MSAHETTTLPVLDPGQRRRSQWAWRGWAYLLVLLTAAALAYHAAAAYQIGQGQ